MLECKGQLAKYWVICPRLVMLATCRKQACRRNKIHPKLIWMPSSIQQMEILPYSFSCSLFLFVHVASPLCQVIFDFVPGILLINVIHKTHWKPRIVSSSSREDFY